MELYENLAGGQILSYEHKFQIKIRASIEDIWPKYVYLGPNFAMCSLNVCRKILSLSLISEGGAVISTESDMSWEVGLSAPYLL